MAQGDNDKSGSGSSPQPNGLGAKLPLYRLSLGVAAFLLALVISLLIWGDSMGFPTTVSHQTSSDGSIILERSLRDVTAGAIDDAVDWMTVEGAWLFDGLSNAVNYALGYIERVLKWAPWPALVVALALIILQGGALEPPGLSPPSRCFTWALWTSGRTQWTPLR